MSDNITVSRELLRQAIDALNEADNVLTSSMFAEAADALRAVLEQSAPVQEPGKLDPLTQLQVAYVMGLRDSNSATQPAPEQKPLRGEWQGYTWNPYTAQPRKAVKLTHEQAKALAMKYSNDPLHLIFQTEVAVWAKLGVSE